MFIHQCQPDIMSDVMKFLAQESPFGSSLFLISDPHFQWGGKSSSVLRFFSKFYQISTLHHLTI